MFPHDFNCIDANSISQVKNKYAKRIKRFYETLNSNHNICLVYCNSSFSLNDWQKSVYNEYNTEILKRYNCAKNNIYYLKKIKEIFKKKQNISITSLSELKNMLQKSQSDDV